MAKLVVTEFEDGGGAIEVKRLPRMEDSENCPCFACKLKRALKDAPEGYSDGVQLRTGDRELLP